MPAGIHHRPRRVHGALLLALAVALAAAPGAGAQPAPPDPVTPRAAAALAATATADLCAVPGTVDLPGRAGVPIWGFARKPAAAADCAGVTAQLPGPALEFAVGDVVALNITNAIPGHTLSFDAPGLALGPDTDAAPGATVAVTFTATDPGTYLYASVGDAGRQQAMGLYGALLVCGSVPCPSSGTHFGSPYDRAATLVLGAIDPQFNAGPDGFDLRGWAPSYWLVNGRARPDVPDLDAAAGQRVLLRYLDAGPDHVTMTMLGMHGRLVARDAFKVDNPLDVVAETVPSGGTADIIATVPAGTPSGTRLAIYNRQLRLNNGAPGDAQFTTAEGAGMMTFVHVP
jgi:FtsP/CotA-like multicopper oxidase with cupredoxin domain